MKPSDRNKIKISEHDINLKRKKFLKKVAMTTALFGVAGIAAQNFSDIKTASAMMKPGALKLPISKPAGSFIGSNGNFRPIYKPTTSASVGIKPPVPAKPGAGVSTVKPPVPAKPGAGVNTVKPPVPAKPGAGVNTVKPPVPPKPSSGATTVKPNSTNASSGTVNKPGSGTDVIQTGNTSSLINRFEGMNKPGGGLHIETSPNKPAPKPPTAPSKPQGISGKPPTITQTNTGSSSTGSGGLKPGSTAGKPGTGSGGLKPGSTSSTGTQTGSGGLKPGSTADKPGTGTGGLKPGSTSSTGTQTGSGGLKPGSTADKPGTGTGGLKPGSTSSTGMQTGTGGLKPGSTSSTGTQTGSGGLKPGSTAGKPGTGVGTQTSLKTPKADSLKADGKVNSNRIDKSSTSTTTTVNNSSSGGGKFSKVMAVFGVLTTGAFLATSIVGILQGQQSLESQRQLQNEAIQAQQDLIKNQQREEYEKLAAQLGGKYDPETGVIILPSGSKLNVTTGIVTHPDGSWTDANGNLHMPDGSGVIKPNGNIQINGVGTIDKDGNLVLNDGSGHYDPQGNFHASGQLNSVIGIAGGAGYGGMFTDTKYGGTDVINQSSNYGKKAYDGITHEEAYSKANAHSSVEKGVFTAKEFDSITNLIISAKLNKPMAEKMTQDGQFNNEQLQVILDLLDIYEKNGKI